MGTSDLDRLERTARLAGRPVERLSTARLLVSLGEGREVTFRHGGGRSCLRAFVTVNGEPEAEVIVQLDRALSVVR